MKTCQNFREGNSGWGGGNPRFPLYESLIMHVWLVLKDITFNFCLIFPCSNGNSCLLEVVIHANNILLKTCSQDSHNINDEMVRKLKNTNI